MTDTTRYSPALIPVAHTLAVRGALEKDLATAFGVPSQTIRAWKQQHPDFAAACRLPPDVADEAVERALFSKATGYDRETERVILQDGQLLRTNVTEHVPPCDKAATFWLRVRRPGRWGPPPPVMRGPASALSPTEEALRDIEGDAYEALCAAQDGEPAMEGDDDALVRIDALDPGAATPAADDGDPLAGFESAPTHPSSQRKLGSLSTVSRSHLEGDPSFRWDDGQGASPTVRDTLPHRYQVPLPALTAAMSVDPVDADPPRAAGPDYDPAFIPLARRLADGGALDRDLARAFGVTPTTLRQWTLRHAAFGAACRLRQAVADDAVEDALFARATGYGYLRERVFLQEEALLRTEIPVALPPSLPAALFWLTRRRADRWSRHRQRPDLDPADAARLIAETRARVAEIDLHRRHWRAHGCAPPGRDEPVPPDELWSDAGFIGDADAQDEADAPAVAAGAGAA